VGITADQFVEACQKGVADASDFAKVLFDQVLASDDFVAFKKMMFERNKFLETEALAVLHEKESGVPTESIEDPDYALAIHLSNMDYEKQKKKAQQQEEDELQKAIENSMKEMSSLTLLQQQELDDLSKAIAASLAAEEEKKKRKLKEEEKQKMMDEEKRKLEAAKLKLLQEKGKSVDDETFRNTIALSKQRQQEVDRQTAAQVALDRLFSKQTIQKEQATTAGMSEDNKKQRQQQITEQRNILLQQSIELRNESLQSYLK